MGINRFRQFGLLSFGSITHAFKVLSRDAQLLEERVDLLQPIPRERFTTRHDPICPIHNIPPEETYYLGYVIERELKSRLENDPTDPAALKQQAERNAIVALGKANHEAYLASDHLDVYIATSMRQRHEFLVVSKLARQIFAHPELVELKLRYFDPTQAYCQDRMDKGLAEGLMLKRAQCTIYLAQESDTLGKDSELASTLAQGKPVIAYVPAVEAGFAKNLLTELSDAHPDKNEKQLILAQLQLFEPDAAWTDPQVRKWIEDPTSLEVGTGISRLQASVARHYDKRAEMLHVTHPLGIQVNLETGVANGVLVVRNVDDCASLVRGTVTRTLGFDLEEADQALILREKISRSVFRIATRDMMLTNAFWNFYLEPSE
jgi:hypothetical protein